jgi:O-antigen/teichoic acid export membrane protein
MLIMAPAQAAQVLVGIGSVVVFTRLMSPEDYGRYALILSASMLAHTVALTWAEAAAFRFLPQAAREGRQSSHFAVLLVIGIACIALCSGIAAFAFALAPAGDWGAAAIGFAAALSGFRFITKVARETDRAEQRIASYALRETAFVAGGFAVGVAILALTPAGPAAPFIGACVAGACVAVLDAPRLWQRARGGEALTTDFIHYAVYGAPLAASLAVDLVMQTSTRAMLTLHVSDAAAGAFAASSGVLGRALDILFVWTALAFSPALLRAFEIGDRKATENAAADLLRALMALCLPAMLGLCLVAEPLCALLVGEALAADAAALAPFIVVQALAAGMIAYFITEAFVLRKKTMLRLALLVPVAIAHVALLAIFVPTHGLIGAGWASVASALFGVVALGAAGLRLLPIAAPTRDLAKVSAACIVMSVCVFVIPSLGGVEELAIKSGVGILTYAAMLFALNFMGLQTWVNTRLGGAPA